jgi:hypothetical protein
MKNTIPLAIVLWALLPFTGHSILLAQIGGVGVVLGVVKDSTGAVISGAEVTVTNLETGLLKTGLTDAAGNFELLNLPIGSYSVSVSMTGFKTLRVESAELKVSERKRLSPILQVGDVAINITVEAVADLLQNREELCRSCRRRSRSGT